VTPEQEDEVRRALAAAAHPERLQAADEPGGRPPADPRMPADVAARLDEVLEALVAPRTGARKRRWPQALAVAAAAAVVVGAGAAVVTRGLPSAGSDSSASSATDSRAGSDRSGDSGSDPGGDSGGDPGAPTARKTSGGPLAAQPQSPSSDDEGSRTGAGPRAPAPGRATRLELHRATLQRDLERLLAAGPTALRRAEAEQPACSAPALRAGEQRLAVRLDGRPATLVLGVPTGGRRAAGVYSCSDPRTPLSRTTVPLTAP
jgi:hypothetical protein